jgi:hypothetical protein
VQIWNEHKHEYFGLKDILFVTGSDSPTACNLSGQSKKVGCRCAHYFREIDSQYLSESRKTAYMGHRRYIPIKHQFWSMTDQFNGNTERGHPPPHLKGHEVYKMVKDVHVVLGKRKRTARILNKMTCGRSNQFFGATVLDRLRCPSFDQCDAHKKECVREPHQNIT